ncbi:hypothetical protein FDG2_1360 [Candidatus Protofrankia californiensis]|uniref:HAD-superfamily hydrolase n=1 Tax=Candidatus Protofrankia californiensis TaxID=1839754 RepID=A0A1C3NVH7_9ACTN|nr:hypothetical protein FDG2_1360 [Candidatus Protofrankia californiensis]
MIIADGQEIVRTGPRVILDAQPDIDVIGEATKGRRAVELAQRLHPDVCLFESEVDARAEVLLVDMDGTLVYSDEARRRTWTLWAAQHGLDPQPFLATQGRTARDMIADFASWLDLERETTAITELKATEIEGIRPLPGAIRLRQSDRRLAVVTSADENLAHVRLRAAGLRTDRAETIVTAEAVRQGKPDPEPEPYLLVARRMGVDPEQCTVIEDAPAGIKAGLAAGMRVVGLTTTASATEVAAAHLIVANLEEFLLSGWT